MGTGAEVAYARTSTGGTGTAAATAAAPTTGGKKMDTARFAGGAATAGAAFELWGWSLGLTMSVVAVLVTRGVMLA